ncbi:MAG: hypothetical protein ACTSQF_06980 [Candidatus Heimdallarchaeaceae archaeon]
MSILPPEASIVFAYMALLYNASVSGKLIYESFSKPKLNSKAWNLSSAGVMLTGTVLIFLWFNLSLSIEFIWGGLIGCFLLFINNLIVTILALKGSIEATRWGKIINVLFTILALQSSMLLLNFVEAQTAFILPKALEWFMIIPSIGFASFEAFLYGAVGYFYPVLILIPFAVPIKMKKRSAKASKRKKNPQKKDVESEKKTLKKETKTEEKAQAKPKEKQKESVFTEEVEQMKQEKPPILPQIKVFLDNGAKGIYAMGIILLIVFTLLNIGTMASFGEFTSKNYNPEYPVRNDFEFGVSLKSVTYQQSLPDNYLEEFQKEVDLLKDLNVTTVRMDIKSELLYNYSTELQGMTNELKANGFKLMLSTYGYGFPIWNYQYVDFADYIAEIENQAIEIIQLCDPEFLLIYPEPYGFSSAYVRNIPGPDEWAEAIEDTVSVIHTYTNDTEIGVNLSYNDFSLLNHTVSAFESIWENTTIDFVGIDYYIIHARELDLAPFLENATPSTKELWICEFGISAVMYGERIQAGAIAKLLELVLNEAVFKGFVYFSLQDDLSGGNSLGLVSATGHKRLSFYEYNTIIETVIV